jgi:hypothetical protein
MLPPSFARHVNRQSVQWAQRGRRTLPHVPGGRTLTACRVRGRWRMPVLSMATSFGDNLTSGVPDDYYKFASGCFTWRVIGVRETIFVFSSASTSCCRRVESRSGPWNLLLVRRVIPQSPN